MRWLTKYDVPPKPPGWCQCAASAAEERDVANFLDGYKPVPDSGTQLPSPCGTEEANEGKASGGNKWAKRKFSPGPIIDYDESLDSLGGSKGK